MTPEIQKTMERLHQNAGAVQEKYKALLLPDFLLEALEAHINSLVATLCHSVGEAVLMSKGPLDLEYHEAVLHDINVVIEEIDKIDRNLTERSWNKGMGQA